MKQVKYYLKLYWLSLTRSFMTEMEYRANFAMTVLHSLTSFVVILIFFNVVYFHVSSLAGWGKFELLLLLGVYLLVNGIFDATIRRGLDRVPRYIRRGSLDAILTRPANSLFLVSFSRLDFDDLSQILLALFTIKVAAGSLTLELGGVRVLGFILVLFSGITVLYANYLFVISTSFWFIRQVHQEVYRNFLQMGRIPLDVYSRRTQFLFTFIIPLAFMVIFPARVLLGTLPPIYYLIAPSFAIVNLYFSLRFWRFALRHYSSAGS